MGDQKQHINYTATDIQKYLSGNLNALEMHELEKSALDDPFLAEAIEGYRVMYDLPLENQLAQLKQNMLAATETPIYAIKKARLYRMAGIAAAVTIVFGGIAISLLMTDTSSVPSTIIAKADTISTSPGVAATAPPMADNTRSATIPSTTLPRSLKESGSSVTAVTPGIPAETVPILEPSPGFLPGQQATTDSVPLQSEESGNRDLALQEQQSERAFNEQQKIQDNSGAKRLAAESAGIKTSMYKFSGQVVDPGSTPLPYANLYVRNNNANTYTDVKGYFTIVLPDSLVSIAVRSAGNITRNLTLNSSSTHTRIVLENGPALSKDSRLKSNTLSSTRSAITTEPKESDPLNVEPVDGWKNYDRYLTNNFNLPGNTVQQYITGELVLSMELNSDQPENIRIIKSLGEDCDNEITRLLTEGPKFRKSGAQKTANILTIKFTPF